MLVVFGLYLRKKGDKENWIRLRGNLNLVGGIEESGGTSTTTVWVMISGFCRLIFKS